VIDVNAPTMPDIALPHVDVHDVSERVQERVQELAASAAERFEDLPERAVALAGAVIPALRPTPKRSKRPLLILVVAVSSLLAVAWFLRSRRDRDEAPYAPADSGAPNLSAAS